MKVSLRVRVLLIVSAINLLVYGTGFGLFGREVDEQLRAEYSRSLFDRLRSTVGPQGEINVATILQWPTWAYFDDTLIVHRNMETDAAGRIWPRGAWINPRGRSTRSLDFEEQGVLRDIERAIGTGVALPSHGGTAMPITDSSGEVWGGCWFALSGFESQVSLLKRLLPWFVISTVLITLATFWLLRRAVLDPVQELTTVARRLAGGDLSARTDGGHSTGELGDLIRTFDVMAGQIEGFDARRAREVREATDQVRRAEAAAMTQRRLAATGELAAGIAHEINNPLGGLLNAVDALERGELPPEKRKQYHGLLRSGLERIRTTVGQLLRFTPRTARAVPLSLVEPVADAIALVQHRAAALDVAIQLSDATGRTDAAAVAALRDLPPVLGEAHEIGQAVLNLLVNALDALEDPSRGKRGGRIDVRLSAGTDAVQLVVEDDGPGVAPEDLPRIADLFFTTKDVGKGTGLGLAIVHRIVHQHGGAVHLASEPGRGLRVEIVLPAWRPDGARTRSAP
ncbi:MAG: ATP-binding protein [Planctomycetota bacterium]|nr:ATP-binding protein [Planctomycetota bacterium]